MATEAQSNHVRRKAALEGRRGATLGLAMFSEALDATLPIPELVVVLRPSGSPCVTEGIDVFRHRAEQKRCQGTDRCLNMALNKPAW
jgi:hypothetical protein